jgi:hypothetical protein
MFVRALTVNLFKRTWTLLRSVSCEPPCSELREAVKITGSIKSVSEKNPQVDIVGRRRRKTRRWTMAQNLVMRQLDERTTEQEVSLLLWSPKMDILAAGEQSTFFSEDGYPGSYEDDWWIVNNTSDRNRISWIFSAMENGDLNLYRLQWQKVITPLRKLPRLLSG